MSWELLNSFIGVASTFLELIGMVPPVLWTGLVAAILTSVITLTGVFISNASNTKRLLIQLEHDSNEKASERMLSMRRDVYLRTAVEMDKACEHLAQLHTLDPTKVNVAQGTEGFRVAISHLRLIGDRTTGRCAYELLAAYTELFFKMLAIAEPIHDLQSELEVLEGHYNENAAEVARVLSRMKQFNEEARINDAEFSALRRSAEFSQGQVSETAAMRANAFERRNALNIEYSRRVTAELSQLSPLQTRLVESMRRELSLEAVDLFSEQDLAGNSARVSTAVNEFLDRMGSDRPADD